MVARARAPHLPYPTNIHTLFSRTFEIYWISFCISTGSQFAHLQSSFWFIEWLIRKMIPDIVLSISWVPQSILCGFYTRSRITQQPCQKTAIFMPTLPRRKQNSGRWGISFKITRLLHGLTGAEAEIWFSQSLRQTASEVSSIIHTEALCKL